MIDRRDLLAIVAALCVATPTAAATMAQGLRSQSSPNTPIHPTTNPEQGPKPMTDQRVAIYDTYLSAWSAIPDPERRRLLRESVVGDIVFTNPLQSRAGLDQLVDHLEAFQQRSPNGKFVSIAMLGWDRHALATWQLIDAEGKPGFTGYDVLEFNEQGLIKNILLFSNLPKQILR